VKRALRTVLLAIFFAFAIGFGIGTWLRCQMEKPPVYIGARDDAGLQLVGRQLVDFRRE
jgi:hypothetical protein